MLLSQIGSPSKSRRTTRAQRGFTLIEVLVTLALVAIGFLGATSIQSFGLQQTHNTYFRTQADLMLRDIADRMRANPQAARDNAYVFDQEQPTDAAAIGTCDGQAINCSSAEMAVSATLAKNPSD